MTALAEEFLDYIIAVVISASLFGAWWLIHDAVTTQPEPVKHELKGKPEIPK